MCRPGGTIGLLSWTPEGMIGNLFATMKPFMPPPPPGASPAPLWGSPDHLAELFGDRVDLHTTRRDVLEVTAFPEAHDYAEHFRARYGPTIAAPATPSARTAPRRSTRRWTSSATGGTAATSPRASRWST